MQLQFEILRVVSTDSGKLRENRWSVDNTTHEDVRGSFPPLLSLPRKLSFCYVWTGGCVVSSYILDVVIELRMSNLKAVALTDRTVTA
jgi:hypothetical protein